MNLNINAGRDSYTDLRPGYVYKTPLGNVCVNCISTTIVFHSQATSAEVSKEPFMCTCCETLHSYIIPKETKKSSSRGKPRAKVVPEFIE